MTPEEALRQIKTLIEGSDYLTEPRSPRILIDSIRVLVNKGIPVPSKITIHEPAERQSNAMYARATVI